MITAAKIAKIPSKDKPYKVADEHGLYLYITPSGGKLWRYGYRYGGKKKTLAIGVYPGISLADARDKRDAARIQLNNGFDPCEIKKAQKALLTARATAGQTAETFEAIAREWHEKWSHGKAKSTAETTMRRLEQKIFPWMGARPIAEIETPELLAVLRRIESQGILESTRRIKIICGQIFRYAVATGRAKQDPSSSIKKDVLKTPETRHMASITDPKQVGPLLRAIDGYKGSFVVKCALQLQALFFCRPGELRHAEWKEFDIDAGAWSIPAEKMKMKQPHIVPLSSQAVEILKSLQPLTGRGRWVFPSHRSAIRPMSENAVNAALRRMGIEKEEMCGHGFRAMARTILDEVLQQRYEFIEHQLAHAVRDANGRAYNRTAHLEDRKAMMQLWADYLDGLKAGAKVLPFRQKTA